MCSTDCGEHDTLARAAMFSYVDPRSRLETIFATISAMVVVVFSFLTWFVVVGLALLYTTGVKLPGTSTEGTAIIFFFVGTMCTLYAVSLIFLIWYLYRRRFVRKQGEQLKLLIGHNYST